MYYPYSQRKFDLFSIYLLSEFILLYRFWDVLGCMLEEKVVRSRSLLLDDFGGI